MNLYFHKSYHHPNYRQYIPQMIPEDKLWKGIIDNFSIEAISLTFPDAHKTLNLNIKPEFLDKELEQLYTVNGVPPSTKIADKLMKVYTLKGEGDYILFHIEVQEKYDPNMGERLFTYFYRIYDGHKKPIITLVIFTENIPKQRPDYFILDYMGTSLDYRFNVYKLTDQQHRALVNHANPFAIVMAAAKMKGEAKRIKDLIVRDAYSLNCKIKLVKQLIMRKLDPAKEKMLFIFIREYIYLENEYNRIKFDLELDKLTYKTRAMGIIETVLIETKLEGIREGIIEGQLKGEFRGRLENKLEIALEMKKEGMPIDQILKFTKLSIQQFKEATI